MAKVEIVGSCALADLYRWTLTRLGDDFPDGAESLSVVIKESFDGQADTDYEPVLSVVSSSSECETVLPSISTIGIERVNARLKGSEVISATILLPSAFGPDAVKGPIDAIVVKDVSGNEYPKSVFQVAHTRCGIASVHLRISEANVDVSKEQVLSQLNSFGRVGVVSTKAGFSDTAALVEYFRDHGYAYGAFFQTLVFKESVVCKSNEVHLSAAFHPLGNLLELSDGLLAETNGSTVGVSQVTDERFAKHFYPIGRGLK